MAFLHKKYHTEVVPALMGEFSFSNPLKVPRITKVVINMGLGEAVQNPKIIEAAVTELTTLAGQKAVITRARKSIAGFKLRQGMPIGAMVTLRGERMWEFLERLIYVALPRVRDFKGVNANSFDGHGNYSLGVKEQIIFPEINYDKVDKLRGMNITVVTTAESDEVAASLLRHVGMPFKKGK